MRTTASFLTLLLILSATPIWACEAYFIPEDVMVECVEPPQQEIEPIPEMGCFVMPQDPPPAEPKGEMSPVLQASVSLMALAGPFLLVCWKWRRRVC